MVRIFNDNIFEIRFKGVSTEFCTSITASSFFWDIFWMKRFFFLTSDFSMYIFRWVMPTFSFSNFSPESGQ